MSTVRLNDTNLFAYCGNDPVCNTDTGGTIFFTLLGAAIGAATSALDAYMLGNDVKQAAIAGAVSGAISGAGVDFGAAVTISSGGAGLGLFIAGAAGFGGGFLGAGIATGWQDPLMNYAATGLVSGMMNTISFGLAPIAKETPKMGFWKAMLEIARNGLENLGTNVTTGVMVTEATIWTTHFTIQDSPSSNNRQTEAIDNTPASFIGPPQRPTYTKHLMYTAWK